MKVLFLDFDGVINTFGSHSSSIQRGTDPELFSPAACSNLNSLLHKVPELKVVVSSAWRMWGLDHVKKILEKNGIDSSRVIDITGNERGVRGYQIQCWIDRNPGVTNIVIIDDESDMDNLMNKLVKTSSFIGLTSKDVDLALDVLKTPLK